MTLVDTSVWIDHFRTSDPRLSAHLRDVRILIHPFVVGEISLGATGRSRAVLRDLAGLPEAEVATCDEVLLMIERDELAGTGIGYVDAHLLASARLSGAALWTRDKRLKVVAERLALASEQT